VIRKPLSKSDEERISFYPFEVYFVNGERIDATDLNVYLEWMEKLKDIFEGSDLVRVVHFKKGGVKTFNMMWEEWAEKKKQEGLVIRTSDGKIYKVKTSFNFDVVIIFFTKGTGKYKKVIGAAGVALMDKSKVFRFTGLVGTGWTDEMRAEMMNFAKKNEVKNLQIEKNPPRTSAKELIWVQPKIILEVKWKDIYEQMVPGYKFEKNSWKEVGEFPGVIMREPRVVRVRDDKRVTPFDLRLEQIPDWKRKEKKILEEYQNEEKAE
jgi:ATP-dependent DNA ligase